MVATETVSMTHVWRYMAGDSLTTVPASLTQAMKDRYRISDFRADWSRLSDQDKADLKQGLQDGTFTY